jgi:hypothetical protein
MTDNRDINQKLQRLEEQLDAITSSISNSSSRLLNEANSGSSIQPDFNRADEIDLRELWNVLWRSKWWIIAITFLFGVAGVTYALSLPNRYTSEGIYAPAQQQGGSALAAQYGGLASLAGIKLGGGESNDIDQAMALITSWPFLEMLINKHNLKPLIMGVKGWDREKNELIWDDEIYDPIESKWLREPTPTQKAEPSSYEAYKRLRGYISTSFDAKTNLLQLAVEYYSPYSSKKWVEILIHEVNEYFQLRDMVKARKSIEYLEKKINETSIAEMQTVFYGMIEQQTKTLMLAEVEKQYLLIDVIQPKVAELKSSPKRALIILISMFLGGMLAVIVALIRSVLNISKVN